MSRINMAEIMLSKMNIHYREECPPLRDFANDNFTMAQVLEVMRDLLKFREEQADFMGALADILEKHIVGEHTAETLAEFSGILRRYQNELIETINLQKV